MNTATGWERHLSWLVPLLLVPLSIWIFGLIAAAMLTDSDSPATASAMWIGVICVICAVVAPVVFFIMTIIGMQKTYRTSELYARKMRKRNALAALAMEAQIVREGGPQCDAVA